MTVVPRPGRGAEQEPPDRIADTAFQRTRGITQRCESGISTELVFGCQNLNRIGRKIERTTCSQAQILIQRRCNPGDTDRQIVRSMLYTHLSNGLMNVVVGGYNLYEREEVIRFVNEMLQTSLASFR